MRAWMIGAGVAAVAAGLAFGLAGSGAYQPKRLDAERLLTLAETLSGDEMAGRAAGGEGGAAARELIKRKFVTAGLQAYRLAYEHRFQFGEVDGDTPRRQGSSLVGRIEGADPDGPVLLVSAHYDHLGVKDGEIYNGADDNASGVAALVAIAEWFQDNPPEHTVVFAAFDAEEEGLQGARDFVRDPPVALDRIALNFNLDMVARADSGVLYAAGAYHRPGLAPLIREVAKDAPIELRMGHDAPADGEQDWTLMSDHGPFHQAGVAFVYLGVEDPPDYHQPSDTFDRIDRDAFLRAAETAVMAAELFDARLDEIARLEPKAETSEKDPDE